MPATRVATTDDVRTLAEGLLEARRDRPWCVISTAPGTRETVFDVAEITKQIGDVVDLFVIENGTATYDFSDRMPPSTSVYNGAARVYPVGADWQSDPWRSPLRLVRNRPGESDADALAHATDALINDALGMANAAGLFERPSTPTQQHASGRIAQILPDGTRAIVQLDGGGIATVWQERMLAGVPLDWLLAVDRRVSGALDDEAGRLDLEVIRLSEDELLERMPLGTVTLALVRTVERQSGTLTVHPGVTITVRRKDVSSNPRDLVEDLLTPGEVVPVRLVRDEQGQLRLTLHDIDDDEPLTESLPVIVGGLPWLEPGRSMPIDDDLAPTTQSLSIPEPVPPIVDTVAAAPAPHDEVPDAPGESAAHVTPDALGTSGSQVTPHAPVPPSEEQVRLTAENERLTDEIARLTAEVHRVAGEAQRLESTNRLLHDRASAGAEGGQRGGPDLSSLKLELAEAYNDVERLKRELTTERERTRALREQLRESRSSRSKTYDERRDRFESDEAWLRHAIELAWIDRVEPGERETWPLPELYLVGDDFIETLDQHDAAVTNKALRTIVDVLTDRAAEVAGRGVHGLRSNAAGDTPQVVRPDGARSVRVYIEQNAPSARRLHYWRLPDGTIELSRVVVHDDATP